MSANSHDNDVIRPRLAPIDPPRHESERDTLVSFLDYYRAVLARKCVGLDTDQLQLATAASTLTLGRLLRHMAFVEDHWFQGILLGRPLPEPWLAADRDAQPDWEMDTSADFTPTELIAQFDDAVARSRAAIDGLDVDATAANTSHGARVNLRWILVHMIEEYARHCGHADLLREAIDGNVDD